MGSFNQDCQDHSDKMFELEEKLYPSREEEFQEFEEENDPSIIQSLGYFLLMVAMFLVVGFICQGSC